MKDGEIDAIEIRLTDAQMLRLSIKSNNGKLYLDARKWVKFPSQTDYFATKKGLMMELDEWSQLLPKIEQIVSANASKT